MAMLEVVVWDILVVVVVVDSAGLGGGGDNGGSCGFDVGSGGIFYGGGVGVMIVKVVVASGMLTTRFHAVFLTIFI